MSVINALRHVCLMMHLFKHLLPCISLNCTQSFARSYTFLLKIIEAHHACRCITYILFACDSVCMRFHFPLYYPSNPYLQVNLMRDSQLNQRDAHPAGSLADTTPRTFGSYPADPVSSVLIRTAAVVNCMAREE